MEEKKNKKKLIPTNPKMGFNQFWLFGLVGMVLFWVVLNGKESQEELSENKFVSIAKSGDVKSIDILNRKIAEVTLKADALEKEEYSELKKGKKKLIEKGPHFTYQFGDVESFPKLEGRQMTMVIAPKKKK